MTIDEVAKKFEVKNSEERLKLIFEWVKTGRMNVRVFQQSLELHQEIIRKQDLLDTFD